MLGSTQLCRSGSSFNTWKPNVKPFSVQATRQRSPVHVTQRQRFEWRQHAPSAWWNWQAGWSTARLVGRPGAVRRHGPLLPRRLSPPCHRVTSHVSPTARATHTSLAAVALHVLTDIPSVAYDSGKRATEMGRRWEMGRTEFICDPSVINKTKNKQNVPGFSRGLFVCSVHVFFYCLFFFPLLFSWCSFVHCMLSFIAVVLIFLVFFIFVVLFLSCLRSSLLNSRWSKRSKLRGCLLPPP